MWPTTSSIMNITGTRNSSARLNALMVTESVLIRRLLLVYGGQQQLQRARNGNLPALESRPGVPRQLHVVEKPGHEFGAHRRAVAEPGANDSGRPRPAARLGIIRPERGERSRHLRSL